MQPDHPALTDLDLAPHHRDTIANLVEQQQADPGVLALVLGGSLAHGFARPDSDVDVTIVVSSAEYERRVREGVLHHNDTSVVTYDGGYIDGKFVDVPFLERVAAGGSDPARFAYADARVLFSRLDGLEELLASIAHVPEGRRQERLESFAAQLMAWRWYHSESVRQGSRYLEVLAQSKLVLFTCRTVLAANGMLFPFHKWMLRVTAQAPHQPADLAARLDALLASPTTAEVDAHVRSLLAFYDLDHDRVEAGWPTRFMQDTELAWLHGHPPVDEQ